MGGLGFRAFGALHLRREAVHHFQVPQLHASPACCAVAAAAVLAASTATLRAQHCCKGFVDGGLDSVAAEDDRAPAEERAHEIGRPCTPERRSGEARVWRGWLVCAGFFGRGLWRPHVFEPCSLVWQAASQEDVVKDSGVGREAQLVHAGKSRGIIDAPGVFLPPTARCPAIESLL